MMGGYYKTDNLHIVGYEVLTNKPGNGAYRAPGAPQATFAIEQAVDELAGKLGMDPLEFRLQNASAEGDPHAERRPWPRIGLREILETMREHPLWKNRATPRRTRASASPSAVGRAASSRAPPTSASTPTARCW